MTKTPLIAAAALLFATPAVAQSAPTAPAAVQAPAAPPVPSDPARLTAAREVVDEVLPVAKRQEMFGQLVNAMMKNMTAGLVRGAGLDEVFKEKPKAGAVFAAFIARQRDLSLDDLRVHTPELIAAYTDAYARNFTVDELGQLKAWLGTPIGQKYVGFAFAIAGDPEIAAWQKGVMERAQKRVPGEVEKLMNDLKSVSEQDPPQHAS
ncbi:MAG TPA: DUF2059 domain-containing protein [Sphingomonas sp.]|nr:DUF2059 domain-containing protein [Sphingomonas sp.]